MATSLLRRSWSFSPVLWQTAVLFGIDMATNVTDYAFHLYLGRQLAPGDFATVQTVNAMLLVLITTFAVLQPVIARAIAAQPEAEQLHTAVFQIYLWQSTLLGLLLTALVWVGSGVAARWLNLPQIIVQISSSMILLGLLRPVVQGLLQGRNQFLPFGLVRTVYAVGRLGFAVLLLSIWGANAVSGVAAMPLAALLSLLAGLWFVGRGVWQRTPEKQMAVVGEGWRLSLAAFFAYAAYMSLFSLDLIWVNAHFGAAEAGAYATAVVLRRVLSVLPGAAVVVFYPRVVQQVAQGKLPDGLVAKTAVFITIPTLALTFLYFAFGSPLLRLAFGGSSGLAAPLLGWLAAAMLGYGIGSIWLNLFLATRPWPFVGLLLGSLAVQAVALRLGPLTLGWVTAVFLFTGLLLAAGGAILYLFWLRPRLHPA